MSSALSSSYITSRLLVTDYCVATVVIIYPLHNGKNRNYRITSSFAGMINHVKKKKTFFLILNDPVNTAGTVIEHNIYQPMSSHNSITKKRVDDTFLVLINANDDDETCKNFLFDKLKGNKSNINNIAIAEYFKQVNKSLINKLGVSWIKIKIRALSSYKVKK